ncbi:caspase family protein [Prosthecodimorpha staleyi]|uniref:Caspase family protein n=1 Tax=Prosthecodimorpha staleyi TaxID=2840188 RepID=A0A947D5Q5_9HYPH|nr:caspase family protein [Prosthecodimorpha staleyi]MBT9290081.1 caspase family protein [Prosthecodimorpha staleyi]
MSFHRTNLIVFLFAVVFVFMPQIAEAKRVALLIGNAAYRNDAALQNPENDLRTMRRVLEEAGFDVIIDRTNVDRMAFSDALNAFELESKGAEIGVVFFSGHGIEVNGVNYLIPVDAHLTSDREVKYQAIPLDDVMAALEGASRLKLILLDACRDNPFIGTLRRTKGSVSKGLRRIDDTPEDVLVAYAAAPGQTALDGSGPNSPFTSALARHLTTVGLDIRLALGRVRDDVAKATTNRQIPYVAGSLGGRTVALRPGAGNAPSSNDRPGPGSTTAATWNPPIDASPTRSRVRDFIVYEYLKETARYAESVDYYQKGLVRRDFVLADQIAFQNRWPIRSFQLIEETLQVATFSSDKLIVTFKIMYRHARSDKTTSGVSAVQLTLRHLQGSFVVEAVKEVLL